MSLEYADPATDGNSFTTATTTYTAAGTLIAVPVEGYNFNFAALTASPSTTGTATQSATTSTEPPASSTSHLAPPTTSAAPSKGLTAGAKIGIAVGVAALVLLIGAIFAVFALRRRRKQRMDYMAAPIEISATETMAELSGQKGDKPVLFYQRPVEVDGSPRPLAELQ
jgi:hypothetical protein